MPSGNNFDPVKVEVPLYFSKLLQFKVKARYSSMPQERPQRCKREFLRSRDYVQPAKKGPGP